MSEISVVTSTRNRSGLLRQTLSGVLAQEHVDLDVVVVDNGSTDDTPGMLAAIDDPRLSVLRNETSLGPTGGRNTGLAAATGTWVSIVDDDDLWAPDKLRRQLDAAARTGRDWVYGGCVYIDRDNRIIGGTPPPAPDELMDQLPVRYVVPAGLSGLLWRREILPGAVLDERFRHTTDWDLSLQLAREGPPARVNHPVVAYRQHAQAFSVDAAAYRQEFDLIADKHADLLAGRSIDLASGFFRFVGSQALRSGDRRTAAKAYLEGWRRGDRGCLVRSLALPVPRALHRWLRRRLLSDHAWIDEAERWVRAYRDDSDGFTSRAAVPGRTRGE